MTAKVTFDLEEARSYTALGLLLRDVAIAMSKKLETSGIMLQCDRVPSPGATNGTVYQLVVTVNKPPTTP